MIRYKNYIFEDYFINPKNGEITDKNGIVQEQAKHKDGWLYFKKIRVHVLQMHTNFEVRDTSKWVIHHKDFDKTNNSLDNLVYLTPQEHGHLHMDEWSEEKKQYYSQKFSGEGNPMKERKHSLETIEKIRKNTKHKKGKDHPLYGKKHKEETIEKMRDAKKGKILSDETKNKISESIKKKKWFTNGVNTIFCEPENVPEGYRKGRK